MQTPNSDWYQIVQHITYVENVWKFMEVNELLVLGYEMLTDSEIKRRFWWSGWLWLWEKLRIKMENVESYVDAIGDDVRRLGKS